MVPYEVSAKALRSAVGRQAGALAGVDSSQPTRGLLFSTKVDTCSRLFFFPGSRQIGQLSSECST